MLLSLFRVSLIMVTTCRLSKKHNSAWASRRPLSCRPVVGAQRPLQPGVVVRKKKDR